MSYLDNVNQDLLSRIPLNANKVLEIGCGIGSLGFAYKLRNPGVLYSGIELDHSASRQASSCLDEVWCGDVEEVDIHPFNDQWFDCIIYGDVLENLKDPGSCLKLHSSMLLDDGEILACIPNVQHWSTFANLFNGVWPLESRELFDRTHLRWFTRKSIISLFTNLGLVIHELKPRIFAPEKAKEMMLKLRPSLEQMQIDPEQFLQEISPLQYVVRAGKKHAPALSVNGLSSVRPASMAEVRLNVPFRALQSRPGISYKLNRDQLIISSEAAASDRVLIWQRPIFEKSLSDYKKVKSIVELGYILIIEYDDSPARMHKESDYLTFKLAHGVQVSTPEIACQVRNFNPEVQVFLNNALSLQPERTRNTSKGLRIFFGALNREEDWAPLMSALNDCLAESPDFWSFSVVHDRAFYSQLQLPEERKSFLPLCDYQRYQREMSACDIAFLPLRDTSFNRMKSDLKAIEASTFGLVSLANEVVYAKSFINGETAAFFRTPDHLKQILRFWREQPQVAFEIGRRARQFVGTSRLQCHQIYDREAWYRDLCSRREELTQALYKRVPELNDC